MKGMPRETEMSWQARLEQFRGQILSIVTHFVVTFLSWNLAHCVRSRKMTNNLNNTAPRARSMCIVEP